MSLYVIADLHLPLSVDKPMDITAIGTIAEVGLPNTFLFRQNATDFQVIDG